MVLGQQPVLDLSMWLTENQGLAEQRTSSSPISSGGAGTFFEQHVAAYWLAQLLVRGIPPILIDTTVAEVHFQTEHLGWQTDDFLIVCERSGTGAQKLAGQVKRSFLVSTADTECKKAIKDFWYDFNNTSAFSQTDDRLVLVTLRGTNILLEHFAGLLDCARAARNGEEFERRLSKRGFISSKAVHYCNELCTIISEIERKPVAAVDIWPFLRSLHMLSLDLYTSTRQTEAQIKNLLAHTATEDDAFGVADATWNSLLSLASTAMSEARSLSRIDLSAELQNSHGMVGVNEKGVLRALENHTAPVLRAIHSMIGPSFHLQRAALVQEVLGKLETAQIVLVSGPAGSGKSAIGKDAVTVLENDHFVFGFRVEEFAQAHIDTTLHAGQIPANAVTLSAILAAQSRKVILIEGVERLLEKTTRDAFSDLMALAADDRSLHIILTCRDYSTEQVRESFLRPAAITHEIVRVLPLDDSDLAEIEVALPALAYPLKNPALRDILRNPYFLDKAYKIHWSAERSVPESERDFRALFWRQEVCKEHGTTAGMGRRRELAFQEIAVRRARALSAYVTCNDLDPAVLVSLRQDSLIVSPDNAQFLVATAHDVLEDWAILQWLEERHFTGEGFYKDMGVAIGAHPAIRRSYRKWVAELVQRDPSAADRLFNASISDAEISSQFRDDTLVSLLKAPSAPEFLSRHIARLMENDRTFFKRVVHLLRVACVKTPEWFKELAGHGSIFNVPDGPSWATVLSLVHSNIHSFPPEEMPLLLGLIEDAVRNISWWAPEIDGAEHVVGIAHWLLAGFDNYFSEEPRNRVLKVIAKIPKADPARFELILRGTSVPGVRRDQVAESFRKIIFSGTDGMPAARDLPDLIVSVGADYLLTSEENLRGNSYSRSSRDLDTHFGINEGLRHDFFPASAHRGPWIPLLRNHPSKALEFLVKVFNHSADWYAHPRVHDPLEPAWEITLTFADGTTRNQWGNPRLWNLYRGTSVGPYVLQSLLMALEKWLLEIAGKAPQKLDSILVYILRSSESAALSAVVSSAATAHPHASGEALLILLSAPDYIGFDRGRMVGESQSSALSGIFPHLQVNNKLYEDERKESNRLPHRGQDLEAAIFDLQMGPLVSRVHAILNRHEATLPPVVEQGDEDRLWRLALRRMDLRQYDISEEPIPNEIPAIDTITTKPSKVLLRLDPKEPESDVREMMEKAAARSEAMQSQSALMMWAYKVFKRENTESYDPAIWQQRLLVAMSSEIEGEISLGVPEMAQGGPGIVAVICIRDHWEELSASQRDWCVERVCSEVMENANEWGNLQRMQRFDMAANRAGASILPLILTRSITALQRFRVEEVFAVALTHPIDEVRWYAVLGVAEYLWASDRAFAMRCVNAIAMEATLLEIEGHAQDNAPYDERRDMGEIMLEVANKVRDAVSQLSDILPNAYEMLDVSEWHGAVANGRILTVLSNAVDDPAAIAGFARAAQTLVDWWDADNDRDRGQLRRERNHDSEGALSKRLQSFVMRTSAESAKLILKPILGAIDRHPREIHWIIQGLTGIEDSRPNTPQYWHLWGLFADGIKRATWVAHLDDDHPKGGEMLSSIFLTSWWEDEVRHWRSLEGHAHRVHALFEALPPLSIVLDDYMRFLYHIGEQSLPEAFVRISNSIKRGDARAMLAKTNTVFLLEVLLQRHVYGRPLELKRDSALRQSVLHLLDVLVENGSSAAFRMRDDFVTPLT